MCQEVFCYNHSKMKTVLKNNSLKNINLIILDVDATLINTVSFIEHTFIKTLKKHGVHTTKSQLRKVASKPAADIFIHFAPHLQPEPMMKDLSELQSTLFHTVNAFPGAIEFLKLSKEKNKKIATATSRTHRTGAELLKLCGLSEYIDFQVFRDDITHAKPHPESILKTLRHFDIPRHKAVMIGDSTVDIEAGKSAGVKTIGVLTGFDKEILHISNPDILTKDIGEVSRLFHA